MKDRITWEDARRYCRLSREDVRMAKELKISPSALMRAERSSRKERWKDPAGEWIRKLYKSHI